MFGYGFLAVVLVLYLDAIGLDPLAVGLVLTLTLDRRHDHLAVADHARGSVRPAACPGGRCRPDGPRRGRVRVYQLGAAADPRRRDRGHLADRQRGRPVPRRRAGGPVADRPRRPPDGDVRLVQPRRLHRDRLRGARCRAREPGTAERRLGARRCLPGHRRRLRADRPRDGRRVLAPRVSRRGAFRMPPSTTASGEDSVCTSRRRSSCGCPSCSPSTPSVAASSRRA